MKKLSLTLFCCLLVAMTAWAQSSYDAMAPFGFATRTSRTDASNSAVYNITGGGAMTYDEALASSSKIVLTSDGTTAMDTEIKNAIKNYSVIIFDGSDNTDFWLNQYIAFDGLKGKTLIGVNGARLCTQFYLTSEIHQMLNNYPWTTTTGTQKTGVKARSTSSNSNKFGNLPNGQSVGEESEYLTRKALMEYLSDNDENFRKAGVFQFKNCENFIIRNLKFVGPGPCDVGGYDLMSMSTSSHFWVDHCEFTDGIDGNFDITNNSDFSTISWCTFAYTDRAYAHMNTNLVGSSDTDGMLDGAGYYLNLTWAYNHWGNKCDQRMPMARAGKIHMLNNYYTCTNNSSSINPRKNSEFYIEGNYFADGVKKVFSQTDATAYQWISSGSGANVIASSGVSTPSSLGTVTIPYTYDNTLTAANVPTEVGKWAGATIFKMPLAPTATVSVSKTEVKKGASVVLTAETNGNPEPTIQWYSCSNEQKANAQAISGATDNTYSPSTTTIGGPYYYYAQVTNSQGSATSNVVSFSVVENSDVVWTFNESDLKANTTWNGNGKNYFIANGGDEELEFYGNSNSNDKLVSSNQTIEGTSYTSYLHINSSGSESRRYISFQAPTAAGYITVVYAGTAQNMTVYDANAAKTLTTITGTANSAVESEKITTTAGNTIKLYATSGSVQIYSVIWTPAEAVNASSVIVSPANKTIEVGETLELSAQVLPAGAAQSVTWSSDKTSVAEVDEDGVVTARAIGTAKITATTANGLRDYCLLTVVAKQSGGSGETFSLRFGSQDAGDITSSKVYCDNFTIVGTSEKKVTIASDSKTIDNVPFTYCAKLGGSGSSTSRYISFAVPGPCKIKVYGASANSSETRSLAISSGATPIGSSLKTGFCTSSSTPVAETYDYDGEATNIYIYSTNSGYNVYGIDVTPVITSTPATITKHISSTGWASFVPEKSVVVPDNVNVYYIKSGSYNASDKTIKAVKIPAGTVINGDGETGYIVNASEENDYQFKVSSVEAKSFSDNILACGENKPILNGSLVFAYFNGNSGFYALDNYAVNLPVGIVYLPVGVLTSAGVSVPRAVTINFDEATVIYNSITKQFNNSFFNINGQKVDANYKGIIIRNGRKYINK